MWQKEGSSGKLWQIAANQCNIWDNAAADGKEEKVDSRRQKKAKVRWPNQG